MMTIDRSIFELLNFNYCPRFEFWPQNAYRIGALTKTSSRTELYPDYHFNKKSEISYLQAVM